MGDFDDPFSDGADEFSNFRSVLGPGSKVGASGLLRYREGGDPRDWAAPGGGKYLPNEWQLLAGSIEWTGAGAASGVKEVTLPATFSGLPLVFVTPINTTPLYKDVRCQCPPAGPSTFEIWWFSAENLTAITFAWLAIGPVGL
jgi:hypothetical protein